jgi:hypothetical protein
MKTTSKMRGTDIPYSSREAAERAVALTKEVEVKWEDEGGTETDRIDRQGTPHPRSERTACWRLRY